MPESPYDNEDVVWMIQYHSDRIGWWTNTSMIRRTRSEAIQAYKDIWNEGDKMWRKHRDAGRVRCVWGPLYSKSR